jgi:hypothetical protein
MHGHVLLANTIGTHAATIPSTWHRLPTTILNIDGMINMHNEAAWTTSKTGLDECIDRDDLADGPNKCNDGIENLQPWLEKHETHLSFSHSNASAKLIGLSIKVGTIRITWENMRPGRDRKVEVVIYLRTAHYKQLTERRTGLPLRLLIVGSNIVGSNINNMQCQLSILMTWHVINWRKRV